MHCGEIWDLTQVHLEQKLAVEILLHHTSWPQTDIFLLKIFTHTGIESEIAECNAATLIRRNSDGLLSYTVKKEFNI